jgi:hypothetical protein
MTQLTRWRLWLLAGVALLRLPTLAEPRWGSDDAFFTTVAWSMSRGVPLYRGVYDNSPPGIYWLYRAFVALGASSHHIVVQVAALVAVLAVTLLTFEIGRRLLDARQGLAAAGITGVILSLPTLDGDLFNVEMAGLPFLLAAILVAMRPSVLSAVAAGFFLAAAVIIRPTYVIDGLMVLLLLAAQAPRLRRLAAAAVAAMSFALVSAAVLALQGSLAAYVSVVLPSDHAYWLWSNGGQVAPFALRVLALGSAAALAVFLFRERPGARMLGLWVPLSLIAASSTPRELTHYALEAAPPVALAAAALAARLRPRAAAVMVAGAASVATLELALILPAQETALLTAAKAPPPLLHNFDYTDLPGYYVNWAALVAGRESWDEYLSWFPGRLTHEMSEVAVIRAHLPADSAAMIVLGDHPELFPDVSLLPATPFIATNSSFWRVPTAAATVARAIRSGCADVVIYQNGPGDFWREIYAAGYVEIKPAPWPTFILPRAAVPAGRTLRC